MIAKFTKMKLQETESQIKDKIEKVELTKQKSMEAKSYPGKVILTPNKVS